MENNDFCHNKYDEEPVKYCPKCYSLQIGSIDGMDDMEYCMDCGCSDIKETSIEEWEQLYKTRYGHKFIQERGTPYRRYIYSLSTEQLKTELYRHKECKDIIYEMYPRFPKYLTRVDAVLLVFDTMIKNHETDKLRNLLIKKHQNNGSKDEQGAG